MIYLKAFILFLFPTFLARIIFLCPILNSSNKLGKHCKIGFSFILCPSIELDGFAYIGHFNLINIQKLTMGTKAKIEHLNIIKGNLNVHIENSAQIRCQNKITNPKTNLYRSTLRIKYLGSINFKCIIDMSADVFIGVYTNIAGYGTQIWTHSYYVAKNKICAAKMCKAVSIGDNCYIGSMSCICPGVSIGNAITVGAHTVISKSIEKRGLYVSSSLRFIDFDPDSKIEDIKNNGTNN